jgi:ComF family protein
MDTYARLKTLLLDILFPIECVGCDQSKTFLCDVCLAAIPIHTNHLCHICKKNTTPHGQVCIDCLGQSSLDGILVASSYKNTVLSKTIHLYKYRFIQKLSQPLSRLLVQSIIHSEIPLPDMLCPVPLHPLRLRWRGFNQSELLAQELSVQLLPQLPISLIKGLTRDRFTLPQKSIRDIKERHDNIRNAFTWIPKPSQQTTLQGKYIWLIDDVATTTETLNECAKILKQNGAKKVFGVVLGR